MHCSFSFGLLSILYADNLCFLYLSQIWSVPLTQLKATTHLPHSLFSVHFLFFNPNLPTPVSFSPPVQFVLLKYRFVWDHILECHQITRSHSFKITDSSSINSYPLTMPSQLWVRHWAWCSPPPSHAGMLFFSLWRLHVCHDNHHEFIYATVLLWKETLLHSSHPLTYILNNLSTHLFWIVLN